MRGSEQILPGREPIGSTSVDENWDSLADWYVALVRGGSAMHEFSRDILLSEVPNILSDTPVLDVGCGKVWPHGHWPLAARALPGWIRWHG